MIESGSPFAEGRLIGPHTNTGVVLNATKDAGSPTTENSAQARAYGAPSSSAAPDTRYSAREPRFLNECLTHGPGSRLRAPPPELPNSL